MNNLHRELAPVSDAAWASIEEEARRTFEQHVAARRVVDLSRDPTGPGPGLRGHRPPERDRGAGRTRGVSARLRTAQPLVQLRVPFTVSRQDVDDVERGAQDPTGTRSRTRPGRSASPRTATVFAGYPAAGITGVRPSTSNPVLTLPAEAREYPTAVSQAVSSLRLAGVGGPLLAAAVR